MGLQHDCGKICPCLIIDNALLAMLLIKHATLNGQERAWGEPLDLTGNARKGLCINNVILFPMGNLEKVHRYILHDILAILAQI